MVENWSLGELHLWCPQTGNRIYNSNEEPPAELLTQPPRGDGMEGFVFAVGGLFCGSEKSKENQWKWKEPNPLKNAFKNQFKMIEIRGKIYGLLFCGSHDENVFVFFGAWGLVWMAWC